jgi:peptidoglycan/xylan/chitin deacetylase (PgdA/CDA1 family)
MFDIKKNNYIIIDYHYVRDVEKNGWRVNALPVKSFIKQIKYLLNFYKIVSIDELYKNVQEKRDGFWASLSFDDGLIDHYTEVFPILKELKIAGTFFPITMTLEKKIPATHKMHVLLSKISTQKMVDTYEEFIIKEFPSLIEKYHIPRDRKLKASRVFDDILTANLKEIITILPPDVKIKFIDKCFEKYSLNENQIYQDFFMDEGQIKKMKESGMIIGAHTHTHTSLKIMNLEEQEKEIKKSKEILEEIICEPIELFSYPFGDFNDDTLKIITKNNFSLAVSNQRRELTINDKPLILPRYDTNDIPHI